MVEFFAQLLNFIFRIILESAIFWVPGALLIIGWLIFRQYRRIKYLSGVNRILLEIRLPKEINKSPAAMEVVLNVFYQGWESTWFERLKRGVTRTWFSLEMVSIDGKPHFFIWIDEFFKNLIESQLYAQYPEIEIYEVPDYVFDVPYDDEKTWKLWGGEYTLSKPDPYPIKTYVDFGLDKAETKEPFKVDPLGQTMEFLGSFRPGEQCWIQILIQAPRDRFSVKGKWFKKEDWKGQAKAEINKIIENAKKRTAGKEGGGFVQLTPGEETAIKAIERSISKTAFDCGIRVVYIARRESFDYSHYVGSVGIFKQFTDRNLNGLRPFWDSTIDFPWQDFRGMREARKRRRVLDAYRRRSWFYPPYARKPFVLCTEELATIYHFPGGVVTTPTLARIESKKAEPPPNLPT